MHHEIRDLIDDVVDAIVHDLTPGCLTVERRESLGGDFIVWITPKAKESAPVVVSHSGDAASVFVEVGEATTLELQDRVTGLLRDELSDVLSTVVRTGLKERTWWHGRTLVYSEAEFRFSHYQPGEISAQFGSRRLLSRAEVRERRYLPYE